MAVTMEINKIAQLFMEYLIRLSYWKITIDSDWPIFSSDIFAVIFLPFSIELKSIHAEKTASASSPFHTVFSCFFLFGEK